MTNKDQWRVAAVMLSGIALLVFVLSGVAQSFLGWPTQLTADLTAKGLTVLAVNHLQHGTVIFQLDGFAYEIYYRCIGCVPVIVLMTGVFVWPAKLLHKIVGLSIGIPLLLALNIARLLHLFTVGVNHPEYFWLAHRVLWEAAMLVTTALTWAYWLKWSNRRTRETIAQSGGL